MSDEFGSFSFHYFDYFSLHPAAITILDFNTNRIAMHGRIKISRPDQYISFLSGTITNPFLNG